MKNTMPLQEFVLYSAVLVIKIKRNFQGRYLSLACLSWSDFSPRLVLGDG